MNNLIELADAYAEANRTFQSDVIGNIDRGDARAALVQAIDALQRENAELRKDTKRLDWVICNRDMRVQGDDSRGWHVLDCSDGLTFVVREEGSFRSAIDSAMKAKGTT